MGDGKPSFVEKSYKLLFIIYTPIALLSYIINAVGGFEISFFSIFLICIAGLSAVLALVLIVRYAFKRDEIVNTPDSNKNAPFLFRHDFLIPYIFISVLSFTLLSFLMYNGLIQIMSNKKSIIKSHQNSKIALVMGLSNANVIDRKIDVKNVYLNYGASEMKGLSVFRQYSANHGNEYDFILVDHKMVYNAELENEIKTLLEEGVKYFICTTSAIAVPLSKKFEELVKEVGMDNNPILICTNSSSPDIKTKNNLVYRFYIRSYDEAKTLAQKGKELGLKNIAYIAIDNEFGRGAISTFNEEWNKDGNLSLSGIYLDPLLSKNKIIEKIKNSPLLKNNLDAIFVVNSGFGIQNTITALDSFPDDIIILGTSGLSVKYTQYSIKNVLKHKRWFTCTPVTKAKQELFSFNLYTTFVNFSISKLLRTINMVEKNEDVSFHDEWKKNDYPELLEFNYDSKGDFIIKLQIDSTSRLY